MVFTMGTLGEFLPGLDQGDTVLAVVLASGLVWTFHWLITRGIRQAAAINKIVTAAKLLPILVFVVLVALACDAGVLADNFWGGTDHGPGAIFAQVLDTMLVTTFVFLGIEGASVYSRLARRRTDVGRATILGFASTLAVFGSVTLVSYGVLPQGDLAAAEEPSMGTVLESVVGGWGATLIDIGVIVSVLGAYLAWTLLNAEVMFMPATTGVMPRVLARTSRNGTPIAALLATTVSVQLFLLAVLVVDDALDFMLRLDTALTLVPYLLAALYGAKLAVTRQTYGPGDAGARRNHLLIAASAVVYSLFLLYAAGAEYLLLGCLVYAPGTFLYLRARREHGLPGFRPAETAACAALWGGRRAGCRPAGDREHQHVTSPPRGRPGGRPPANLATRARTIGPAAAAEIARVNATTPTLDVALRVGREPRAGPRGQRRPTYG